MTNRQVLPPATRADSLAMLVSLQVWYDVDRGVSATSRRACSRTRAAVELDCWHITSQARSVCGAGLSASSRVQAAVAAAQESRSRYGLATSSSWSRAAR